MEGSTPVTTYTITITAGDEGAAATAATTRLRLDISDDQVILTDLHLHDGKGLSTGQLPAIDYGLLLRAITTTTPTPLASSTAPPAPSRDTTRDTTPVPTAATAKAAGRRTRAAAPVSKTRRGGRGSVSEPAAPAPVAGARARRGDTAGKAAAAASRGVRAMRKTTTATATAAGRGAAGGTERRAYRRMPDDFAAVYRQVSSPAAVADHYQVPRHTVNGWIRRLREQGVIAADR
jgi:hypothetical protein